MSARQRRTAIRITLAGLQVGALAAGLAFTAPPVCAQGLDGAIAGVVKDATGATLPGVIVTVTSLDRGTIAATTHTSGDGSYTAVALPPGTYTVKVELSGFATEEIKPLTLRIADRLRVDVTMALQSLAETVMV
jgi:hypothetical protein